jgi:pyroglutamyl-peptidase
MRNSTAGPIWFAPPGRLVGTLPPVSDALLITGFTAFGPFAANPAETIARRVAAVLGARFEPLEVSYAAAEALVDRLRADPPARWVIVGVASGSDHVRLERVARNRVGPTPDVRGAVRGPSLIDPAHQGDVLPGTLLPVAGDVPPCCAHSDDAGDYLCNFVYWRALADLPRTRSVFVHVVPLDRMPEDDQVRAVLDLLRNPVVS